MTDILPNIVEINDRIDVARENLRALVEQAAAYSGHRSICNREECAGSSR
jgi:hypothetical protein